MVEPRLPALIASTRPWYGSETRWKAEEDVGFPESRHDGLGQLGPVGLDRGNHNDDRRGSHGIGGAGKRFGDPGLIRIRGDQHRLPGLTPPHSMHFRAPRIIWMGLEDPGV